MPREHDLREFCCRLFGWSDERASLVDDAMWTLLNAVARRTAIGLQGESDLVPIAHSLHCRLVGPDRPFVVCDPRRGDSDGSVRAPPSRRAGMPSLAAAIGGSVCLRSNRLPGDFDRLAAAFHESGSAALFLCLHSQDRITDLLCRPLKIPSLAQRLPEFPRLLNAYLDEAAHALGVRHVRFSAPMQQSILHHVKSLSDLEKAAWRLVALQSSGNLYRAAHQLHMAPISLIRWMSRRGWTTDILGAASREDR
ncbi:MAG TPA: hypothetical protein VHT91_01365 [Kofleriaceae bacterium]|nr:hypothetical protein [Kofleriaceae bacterium]